MPTKAAKEPAGINVPLLLDIIDHIKEEPRRFAMCTWVQKKSVDKEEIYDGKRGMREFPACNTAACIGGWAVLLKNKRVNINDADFFAEAMEILRLRRDQAQNLFIASNWPRKYAIPYHEAKTPAGATRVAINRIKHFIKTKGED